MKTNEDITRENWRGCKKKKRYKTEDEAKSKSKEYRMYYYKCKFCNGFHLTSSEPK